MAEFDGWALILVDMQNDFLAQGGYYDRREVYERQGFNSEQMNDQLGEPSLAPVGGFKPRAASSWSIVSNNCKLIDKARDNGMAIAYLRAIYDHGFRFKPRSLLDNQDRKHYPCKPGTWGAELISPIQEMILKKDTKSIEEVIEKHTFNGFFETDLEKFLRRRNVHTVLIAGVETHICVLATAQGASYNQFKNIIIEDCVWTARSDLAECALDIYRDGFGITKLSTEIFH